MMTLHTIQSAIRAPDPFDQMDQLIRAKLDAGRTVKEIFEDLRPLVDSVLETSGLTVDGEEAFLGTLDALSGNCQPDSQNQDRSPGVDIAAQHNWDPKSV
jgi:hypothetical protein